MMDFKYENIGTNTYLVCEVSPDMVLNSLSLGMITHNNIPGIAQTMFSQINDRLYLKYNISAKISLGEFFSGSVNRRKLLKVFKGISDAVIAVDDYMVNPSSLLLDTDYIFVDVSTFKVSIICLPFQYLNNQSFNISDFFKGILFNTQFDQHENCDYVAKLINFINSSPSLNLSKFSELVDSFDQSPTVAVISKPNTVAAVPPRQVSQNPVTSVSLVKNDMKTQNDPSAPVTKTYGTTSVNIPSVSENHVQQKTASVPVPKPEPKGKEKKGGFFSSLFGGGKNEAAQKSKPKKSSGFAIPGQQVSINEAKNDAEIENAVPSVQKNVQKTVQKSVQQPVIPQPPQQVQTTVNVPKVNNDVLDLPLETTNLEGMNYDQTTVLNQFSNQKVHEPYLIRVKNNEKIKIDKAEFKIGKERSYADYFISDNSAISRSHAKIICRDSHYYLVDTNSTNHTYVNGQMISSYSEVELTNGMKVCFANENFEFVLY